MSPPVRKFTQQQHLWKQGMVMIDEKISRPKDF